MNNAARSLSKPSISGPGPQVMKKRDFRAPRLKIPLVLATISALLWAAAGEQSNAPILSPEARQAFEDGLAKFRQGKFEAAKDSFVKVTVQFPNYASGWINLGSTEYRLNQLDDAEKNLRKAVHLDPDLTQAWLTLGIIAYQKGDMDAGLAALSQAVYLEPDNAHAHMYLGVLARKRGWFDAAEEELRKAVELDEGYAEAHYNLALIYTEHQPPELELARRHYYRALDLGEPPDPNMEKILKRAK
jgi:tetratricopeptide (TPR) repeat protein